MAIDHFMTTELITVTADDDLAQVKKIFDENPIHHILVTDNKKLVGVITDCDLYKQLSPSLGTSKETHTDISQLHKKVLLVMTREPICGSADMSINEAILSFYDNHLSCLPIIDEEYRPIGIITWHDIIALIAKRFRMKQNS